MPKEKIVFFGLVLVLVFLSGCLVTRMSAVEPECWQLCPDAYVYSCDTEQINAMGFNYPEGTCGCVFNISEWECPTVFDPETGGEICMPSMPNPFITCESLFRWS